MPLGAGSQQSGLTTRRRILEAAMLRFAHHSYEETKLRDIAADVGVDVALVHRSFGSKEQLFAEAVNAAFEPRRLLEVDRAGLTASLTRRVLEPSLDQALRLIDPLDIVIRSLLSREAIPIIRAALARDFVEPLAAKLDDPAPQRATLIAACLVGIAIFRDVLRAEPLLDEADGDLEALIGNIVDVAIGDVHVTRGPLKPVAAVDPAGKRSPRRRR
jgi:AcrR family transcriptional regulator